MVGEVAVAYATEVKDAFVAVRVKKLVGKFAPLQQTLPNRNKVVRQPKKDGVNKVKDL